MTNTTTEKISKITEKIEKNLLKEDLSDSKVKKLLTNFNKDLNEVKKDVNDNHKELVEGKIKELKDKINETIKEKDFSWGITTLLLEDIRDGLNELNGEIVESEKVFTAVPVIIEHKPGDNVINREIKVGDVGSSVVDLYQEKIKTLQIQLQEKEKDLVELAKWRTLFSEQSPEQATEELKRLARIIDEERYNHKEELGKIKKSLEVAQASNSSEEIVKISQNVIKMSDEYVSNIGQKALPVLGPLVGAGLATLHGTIEAGIYAADKFSDKGLSVVNKGMDIGVRGFEKLTEDGKDVYKVTLENGKEVLVEAGAGLKEFTENMTKLGVDFGEKGIENIFNGLENWRKGWENVTEKAMDNVKDVINENVKVAKEAVKGGFGAKWGKLELGVNMGRGNVLEAKVEGKEEKIEILEEELKNKNAEIKQLIEAHKQELERKDERIKRLEEGQSGQQKDQNQLLLDVVKNISRPGSPTPGNDEELTRLREEIKEKREEIKDLKEEIKGLKQEIKELKQSQQTAQIEVRAN